MDATMEMRRRANEIDEEAVELAGAAGLMALAAEGVASIMKDSVPGEWCAEALKHGAHYVHDHAERVAAIAEGRPTRWLTLRRETWEEHAAAEAEAEAKEAG